MADIASRRRFLQLVSVVVPFGVAGCTGSNGTDSDGDGVVDARDYAPGDPEVQEKSDLQGYQQTIESTGKPSSGDESGPTETRTNSEEIPERTTGNHQSDTSEISDVDGLWPMFQRDPGNTGYDPDSNGPLNAVKKRWEFETDGKLQSSPVIVEDTVYIGSNDGHVYALNASDGSERWRFQAEGRVVASPAVVSDMVYAGDMAGFVYGIDVSTGEKVWRFKTARNQVWSEFVVDDATVYVVSTTKGELEMAVHAIDANDGVQLWNATELEAPIVGQQTGHPTLYRPSIALNAGEVLVSDIGNHWEFDIGDGTLGDGIFWGSSPTSVAVRDNEIFAQTEQGQLIKKNLEDQSGKSFDIESIGRTSPAIGKENVFFGTDDNLLYAVDREKLIKRWSFETGADVRSSPALTDEAVYFGSNDGIVYALDPENGRKKWTYEIGRPVMSSPAVGDGVIYVGSRNGSVYALSE